VQNTVDRVAVAVEIGALSGFIRQERDAAVGSGKNPDLGGDCRDPEVRDAARRGGERCGRKNRAAQYGGGEGGQAHLNLLSSGAVGMHRAASAASRCRE
jgi:hypothetical protein